MLKRIRQGKRRAMQLAATVGPVNLPAVFDRDGGRCWICWRSLTIEHTHFDHVIPLSKGGEHSEDNIRVSCAPCNLRKRDHLPTPELIARIHKETLAVSA